MGFFIFAELICKTRCYKFLNNMFLIVFVGYSVYYWKLWK